jgi:hypothetical protein
MNTSGTLTATRPQRRLSVSKYISRLWIFLVVIPCVVSSIPSWSSTPQSKAKTNGWEIQQFHRDRGSIILDVSPEGLRILIKKSGLVLSYNAPDWKIVLFSARTKKIFTTDIEHFRGEDRVVFAATGNPQFNEIPTNKEASTNIANVPVDIYKSTPDFGKSQWKAYRNKEATGRFPLDVTYDVSPKLAIKPQFATVTTRLYGTPSASGIPIQLVYNGMDYEKHTLLTTSSCRLKNLTKDDFKIPSGYEKVNSLVEVQADLTAQEDASELIESFSPTSRRH